MEVTNLSNIELENILLSVQAELKKRENISRLKGEAETYAAKLFSTLGEMSTHTNLDEKRLWFVENMPAEESVLKPDYSGIEEFSIHENYNVGDRILYKDAVYEALIEVSRWSPAAYPQAWKKLS